MCVLKQRLSKLATGLNKALKIGLSHLRCHYLALSKVDKPAEFQKAVGTELSELLGQPRDKIFIESIVNAKRIRFWYTVKNSNKKMKESYNTAYKS